MLGQRHFASEVTFVHAADLRHRNMGLVSENNGVVWDEFKKCGGRLARCAARQIARIVLDPVANPSGFQHLKIEIRALFKALRFKQFAICHQLIKPNPQFLFDARNRLLHRRFWRDVVTVGVNADFVERICFLTSQWVEFSNGFQFLAEKR